MILRGKRRDLAARSRAAKSCGTTLQAQVIARDDVGNSDRRLAHDARRRANRFSTSGRIVAKKIFRRRAAAIHRTFLGDPPSARDASRARQRTAPAGPLTAPLAKVQSPIPTGSGTRATGWWGCLANAARNRASDILRKRRQVHSARAVLESKVMVFSSDRCVRGRTINRK